jgi:hypothetical protein
MIMPHNSSCVIFWSGSDSERGLGEKRDYTRGEESGTKTRLNSDFDPGIC